jgi:hypothetical protein
MDKHGDHSQPDPPSWEQIEYNSLLILHAPADPEDTLQLAMTRQELAFLTFATQVCQRFIPELGFVALGFLRKVTELSEAQEFLVIPHKLKEILGMELPEDDPDYPTDE